MTLKEQIEQIVVKGQEAGKGGEFVARTIILHLDNQGLSLEGNGWLDDDKETSEAICEDDNPYSDFLDDLGI